MGGTKVGGQATTTTNKAKYGLDFYRKIGAIGGRNGTGHKFAHGKFDPHEAGKIGGAKSRRERK